MRSNLLSYIKKYPAIYLMTFSTSLAFAIGPLQINYLVLALAFIGSFLYLLKYKLKDIGNLLIFGFIFTIFISIGANTEYFRATTLIYLFALLFSFLAFINYIKNGNLSIIYYRNTLAGIIFLYFTVLVIQQISLILNIPVFNLILADKTTFKLNSLAPEPSLAAMILTSLFYCIYSLRRMSAGRKLDIIELIKIEGPTVFFYFYSMIFIKSGLAIILIFTFFITNIKIKKLAHLIPIFIILGIVVVFLLADDLALRRVIFFLNALTSLDANLLIEADHSASLRILPLYFYISESNILEYNFWLGHGIDYNNYFYRDLIPGVEEGVGLGGFIPAHFINYGFLSGMIFLMFVFRYSISSFLSYETFIIFNLFLTSSLNTQTTWAVISSLAALKYFRRKIYIRLC